ITEYGGARVVKSVEEGGKKLGVAGQPLDEQAVNVYPKEKEGKKIVVHKDHPERKRDVEGKSVEVGGGRII
ncbi:hypothetical protein DTX79_17145, partial [Bacilli bacterium]